MEETAGLLKLLRGVRTPRDPPMQVPKAPKELRGRLRRRSTTPGIDHYSPVGRKGVPF